MKTFKKGELVYNRFGQLLTVSKQVGDRVYVGKGMMDWYHSSKLSGAYDEKKKSRT